MTGRVMSAWSPLRQPVFRALWLASLVSNLGLTSHMVGAVWLAATLSDSALLVALVQTAFSLPLVLFGLPAGATADVFDRRRLLLVTQTWMLLAALGLGVFTVLGATPPPVLVGWTFLLGLGIAFNAPGWQATIPELVEPVQLPAAVALNGVALNVGRALGPALGGLLVAARGPEAVFLFNAVSYLGVLAVLFRWERRPGDDLAAGERVLGAIGAGLRYVRFAPALRAVLIRTFLFSLAGSALWVLLPLVAKRGLGLGATGYGVLLGGIGAGSILGAAVLPRVRGRVPIDRRVLAGTLVYGLAMLTLALVRSVPLVLAGMVVGGLAWITLLTGFNVATRLAVPTWVGARALSLYLVALQGGMAVGSVVWGLAATRLGDRAALLWASAVLGLGLLAAPRYRLQRIASFDLSPSARPEPEVVVEPDPDDGPVLVLIEYRIDPDAADEFTTAMRALRRVRHRDGAYRWGLFADLADPSRYVETFVVRSWAEHLRQHERFTVHDEQVLERASSFHQGQEPPAVSHFIHPDAAIVRRRPWARWIRRARRLSASSAPAAAPPPPPDGPRRSP